MEIRGKNVLKDTADNVIILLSSIIGQFSVKTNDTKSVELNANLPCRILYV